MKCESSQGHIFPPVGRAVRELVAVPLVAERLLSFYLTGRAGPSLNVRNVHARIQCAHLMITVYIHTWPLVKELIVALEIVMIARGGQLKNAVGASLAAITTGREVEEKRTGVLLLEVESRASGGRSDEEAHSVDAEDSIASEIDNVEEAVGETETETAPGARSESTQRDDSHNGQGRLGLVQRI